MEEFNPCYIKLYKVLTLSAIVLLTSRLLSTADENVLMCMWGSENNLHMIIMW